MNRRGTALLVALLLVVVLSMLGAAALDLADRRMESGRRDAARVRVRAAGRSALARAIAALRPDSARILGPGQSRRLDSTSPSRGMVAIDSLTPLGSSLFQVSGTAWLSRPGGGIEARDATRELVQLVELQVAETTAVITAGPLIVEGQARVSGMDQGASTSPACSASGTPGPAALVGPPGSVRVDSSAGAGLSGSPPFAVDSALTSGFLDRLVPSPFLVLAGAADHAPSTQQLTPWPTAVGARCDTSDSLNWGDPTSRVADCAGYRPMIRLAPGTMLAGGVGQGVLVAMGALHIRGSFRYEGVILVRGAVVVEDSAVIVGVLLGGDSVIVRGEARVGRSRCAIQEAEMAVARLRSLGARPWSRGP